MRGWLIYLVFLTFPGLWGQRSETLYVGWPCTLSAENATHLPTLERLSLLPDERVVVRTWEAAGPWPTKDSLLLVSLLPTLPDTGYPKADFTIPELPRPDPTAEAPSLFWPIFLALVLGMVLFHRPLLALLRALFHRLYWRFRWEAFLLRYPGYRQKPLPPFAQGLFALLRPYCDFHPGSLLPGETALLRGPAPFQRLFEVVLPPLYEERFLQKPLSPANRQQLYATVYALLRASRPYASRPNRHRLSLCPST
jgi:hypothetical protein